MSSSLNIENEEAYASSQDSDFALETAPNAASDSSDSEDDGESNTKRRRLNSHDSTPNGEYDYNNSGDEAIIEKGKRKQKKQRAKPQKIDEDEGGEGGLIKTRAQRAAEKQERKYAANSEPVTVDIDAIWAEMIAGGASTPNTTVKEKDDDLSTPTNAEQEIEKSNVSKNKGDESDMVRIKRTYNFAGRVHTEEKLVPRDSAEGKLYLSSQLETQTPESSLAKRVTKKAFRSAFEPIVEGLTGRADLNLGLAARMKAASEAQVKKLNTVEKSRMDWAGFVDKEGIKDELEFAGKSKDSYTARQDFLARSEAIRDVDARRARLAGRT